MNFWGIWCLELISAILFLCFLYQRRFVCMIYAGFLLGHFLNIFSCFGDCGESVSPQKKTAGFMVFLLLEIIFYQCIKWSEQRVCSLSTRVSVQNQVQNELKKNEQDIYDLSSGDVMEKGLSLIADCRQMIESMDSPASEIQVLSAEAGTQFLQPPEFFTRIPEVNAVLEQEKRNCEAQGIRFTADIDLEETGAIEVLDLCIILLNLLDNAIRACSLVQLPDSSVRISVKVQGAYLAVSCQNDSNRRIERMIRKTGQGMHILQSMADKYNGRFLTERSENMWKAALILERL